MIKLTLKTQAAESEQKTYNYEFDQPVVTLGRLKENDIQLPHSTVSGFHAQILKEGENYYLVDRGSINGTFLNDQRLLAGEKKLLQDGDTLRVQSFELYFTSGSAVMPVDQGATVQVARQMVMELLGSWESQQEPRIIVMGGPNNGKQVELTEGKTIVMGRGNQCDIVIDHPTISRKHAEVSFSWNGAFVKDLGSANGVYCNDVRIDGTYKLRDRDEVRLGQQNHNDPVRLVFSNPAEALLSKIEEVQITDSKPGAVESKNITGEQEQTVLPETSPEPPRIEENIGSTSEPVSPPTGTEVVPAGEPVPKKKGMSAMTIGLLIGASLLVLLGLVAVALLFYTGQHTISEQKANPEKGTSGEMIVISNENFDTDLITAAMIFGKEAGILEKKKNEIRLKVPSFPNMRPGTQQTEIILEGPKGTVAKAPFLLILPPEIKKMDPVSGRSGNVVNLETNGAVENLEVYFGTQKADVVSQNRSQLSVSVPATAEIVPDDGLKLPVTLALEGTRSQKGKEFLILPGMRIQTLNPSSGNSGAQVRILMDEVPAGVAVYFNDVQASIQTASSKEIVVTVPTFSDTIPEAGRVIAVQLKVNNAPVGPKADFTLLPQHIESFQLAFNARPYPDALGFNEYSVSTNIGTFLVVVAKDEYPSSSTRAEIIARNLNDKIPFFRQNSAARISLDKVEGINSIFADSDRSDRELLLRVFPDDALAYSKITQHSIGVDALAEWWRMLIDSYYKVFIQVQSPSSTGILGSGGSVLQQIYNFYSVKTAEGTKYYKKDLLETLPQDQRSRLVALSLSPPRKVLTVEGKWGGKMTNKLYSNISDDDLELVLRIRQSPDGTISGTAEVNWKVGMGRNEGGFENVAYKKLGTFSLSGMYRKSQAYPLEFSFVEKDSRRLNFVGRLEGEALVGNFEVTSTGEDGSWSVRLRN